MELKMESKENIDWDEMSIGNIQLDHSQNFFASKHSTHERRDKIKALSENMEIDNGKESHDVNDPQENCLQSAEPNIANTLQYKKDVESISNSEGLENRDPLNTNSKINIKQEIPESPKQSSTCEENAIKIQIKYEKQSSPSDSENVEKPQQKKNKNFKNLRLAWSPEQAPRNNDHSDCAPPHAYLFKDIYKQKLEQALHKRDEEERKLREFHSRPVPNFKKMHKKLEERPTVHVITCPETPKTLKNWRQTQDNRKKRLEQAGQVQTVQSLKPKSVSYLSKEPFQPKKPASVVPSKPFQLRSEQRVQERRVYNEGVFRNMEEKKNQQEMERLNREKEEVKELRKLAQFKARPNPFKRS